MLVLAHLVVVGCLYRHILGLVRQIPTQHLLVVGAGRVVSFTIFLSCLHADVHEEHGGSKGCLGQVVVIPQRVHCLVGLVAAIIIGTSISVLGILVVTQDGMHLVIMAFVAQPEHVVRERGHGPVVGTDDALVVIRKCLAAYLCEQTLFRAQFYPGLKQVEVAFALLPPYARVLGGDLGLQARALVVDGQT